MSKGLKRCCGVRALDLRARNEEEYRVLGTVLGRSVLQRAAFVHWGKGCEHFKALRPLTRDWSLPKSSIILNKVKTHEKEGLEAGEVCTG